MWYPAQFEQVFDEHLISFSTGFVVTFRDVPQAITQGKDFADALDMAQDALRTAMQFYEEDGLELPFPSDCEHGDVTVKL